MRYANTLLIVSSMVGLLVRPRKEDGRKIQAHWENDDWEPLEANLEFVELWTIRAFQKFLDKGFQYEDALSRTVDWSREQKDKWRWMNDVEITEASSSLSEYYDLTSLPSKSYDDVIDLVAQRRGIDAEKLKNRDKVESRRKSK